MSKNSHKDDAAKQQAQRRNRADAPVAIGICVGLALGAAFDNIGMGLALGAAIGAAVATVRRRKLKTDAAD